VYASGPGLKARKMPRITLYGEPFILKKKISCILAASPKERRYEGFSLQKESDSQLKKTYYCRNSATYDDVCIFHLGCMDSSSFGNKNRRMESGIAVG
jgi:hypothetical protein